MSGVGEGRGERKREMAEGKTKNVGNWRENSAHWGKGKTLELFYMRWSTGLEEEKRQVWGKNIGLRKKREGTQSGK